jgi:tetratricopeptide (TPR) repeat protein
MRKTVSCSLIPALLTTACAGAAPRLMPPPDLSAAEREACEDLADKARAQVRGGSVWHGAAIGAVGGSLFGAYGVARTSDSADSGGEWLLHGAFFGAVVMIGAGIGAGAVVARHVGVRESAHGDAMDACLRPVLQVRELGPEHPEVARSLHALAFRYYRLGEFDKAEPLFARALAVQEKSLGMDAPEVATTLYDYAALFRRTGRVAEAGELESRAEAIRRANQ